MKLDRSQLKLAARDSMAAARPSARIVTLVYLLLTTVLVSVVERVMGDPFTKLPELIAAGYDPEWAFYSVMSTVSLPLISFISILLSLYACVMGFGYVAYCLRLSREEQAGIGTLIEGFSMVGRVILTNILVGLFTFLWGLLLAIPFAIVVALIITFTGGGAGTVVAVIVLYILLFIGMIYFALRYVLADYALFDAPEDGCLAAVSRSKQLMQGRKAEYFVLGLSFIGWVILEAILGGIGSGIGSLIGGAVGGGAASVISPVLSFVVALPMSLWLTPYRGCTFAHFYNGVSGWGRTGPEQIPPEDPGNFPYL